MLWCGFWLAIFTYMHHSYASHLKVDRPLLSINSPSSVSKELRKTLYSKLGGSEHRKSVMVPDSCHHKSPQHNAKKVLTKPTLSP